MTDLDVYFWRLFALGAGFGVAWCVWPWLVVMGNATRKWWTIPELSHPAYDRLYEMMKSLKHPNTYPDWYCRYVAFRETARL